MTFILHTGDALQTLRTLESDSVDCCVTSPPYWGLRDYGHAGQMGLEKTPAAYVEAMRQVFAEVRRVLKPEGTLWLNLGDSYAAGAGGSQGKNSHFVNREACMNGTRLKARSSIVDALKPKDLVGIPWRVAFALQADGWYLRQDIIWHKPNPMPESVTDRCTKGHEYLFLLAKSERYFFDADAIAEQATGKVCGNVSPAVSLPGERSGENFNLRGSLHKIPARESRNRRSVWTIPTKPFKEAHFAVMPEALVEPCVLAGCPEGGTVLDPFAGAGTVGAVALRLGRRFVGIELNPTYADLARKRIAAAVPGPNLFTSPDALAC